MFTTHNTPATTARAVTPSDSADMAFFCRGLYVGTGGDVTAVLEQGSTAVLFKAVPTGAILPICATRVKATGTTATDLVALG